MSKSNIDNLKKELHAEIDELVGKYFKLGNPSGTNSKQVLKLFYEGGRYMAIHPSLIFALRKQ